MTAEQQVRTVTVTTPSDREIQFERIFDATEQRDQVLQTAEVGANYTYSQLDQLLARLSYSNG